jgi:hypothetical protein
VFVLLLLNGNEQFIVHNLVLGGLPENLAGLEKPGIWSVIKGGFSTIRNANSSNNNAVSFLKFTHL